MYQTECAGCECVAFTPVARCQAIQRLVRPSEVAYLLRWNPDLESRPFSQTVAEWFQHHLKTGFLSWQPDPEDCDRWCSPARTLQRRGGDCDDLAILASSLLHAGNVKNHVVVGHYCGSEGCQGHAWVEGRDVDGWFLLESTNGKLYFERPLLYKPHLLLAPGFCRAA